MRSTFYGFEIAKTGLFAAQRSIDLTAHNISNANTVGYTRQRLLQSSQELVVSGEIFKEVTRGYTGVGVRIDGVEQVRDEYLDKQFRREGSALGMWSARANALGYIEKIFNESGYTGLSASIQNFFSSIETLTKNPESREYRMNLLQSANEMTDYFQHIASQLVDKQADMDEAVNATAKQINGLARNLADLNDRIFRFELNGERANDLRDQRNNLLDTLSMLTDITYSEDSNSMVSVAIGGNLLVDGTAVHTIQATKTQDNPIAGLGDLYELTWSDYTDGDGDPLSVVTTSGKLRAYLDMRDGNSDTNIGIPYIMGRLDALAAGITSAVNAVHSTGWTLPDGVNPSVTGVNFFAAGTPVTARNFSVDAAIKSNVNNIAAAAYEITSQDQYGDNGKALLLFDLQNKMDIPIIGSIEGYEKGFVAEIGMEAAHANQMCDSQQILVDSIDNQRLSISGVSVDEEMTNLIRFQHSYAASARVITAIDEYLDTLINKLGIVGR
jgi:flagellar hook-associated protein 1 FlgK